MIDFSYITTYASDYDLKEYLGLLKELKSEVDYEVNVIEQDLNK